MEVALLLDGKPPQPHAGLVKMRFTESLGQMWRAVVWVINPGGKLKPEDWVGHNLTVKFFNAQGNVAERLDGTVVSFGAVQEEARGIIYRLQLYPRVWKLQARTRSQIFTKISVTKVIERLFQQAELTSGRHYSFKISNPNAYPAQEQLVQYATSDWEFIYTLMITNGLMCFFHSPNPPADPEQLVITDDRSFFPHVKPDPPFAIGAGMPTDKARVVSFFKGAQLVPEKISLSLSDPTKVHTLYTKTKSLPSPSEGELQLFMGSGTQGQLEHLAKITSQALGRLHNWARVASTDPLLRAGRVFSMNPNPENVSGSFLVVEANHYLYQEAEYALAGQRWDVSYTNELLAVPSSVDWRLAWAGLWQTEMEV